MGTASDDAIQDIQAAGAKLSDALNSLGSGATDLAQTQKEALASSQSVLKDSLAKLQEIAKSTIDKSKSSI
jgi:hypothetical protein